MSNPSPDSQALAEATKMAMELLKRGRAAQAETLLRGALQGATGGAMAWLLLAKAQQMRNDFAGMAHSASAALLVQPKSEQARDLELEALILKGDLREARERILAVVADPETGAQALAPMAQRAVQIADYALAAQLLEKALVDSPGDPALLFNLAAAHVALGDLDLAKSELDTVLKARPLDGDAWYNRVTLDRQSPDAPVFIELEKALRSISQTPAQIPAQIPARFARAKAFEDIGEHALSWAELEQANALRRKRMRYDVRADTQTMKQIASVFAQSDNTMPGLDGAQPIFVVGMPRSGTTLLDRMFASHPDVASVGEVNDMALAIMEETGEVASKDALVVQSAQCDPRSIGANYQRRMAARIGDQKRSIDKTPLNFLYAGLIARALPDATIVHIERDPRDIAFAVYKTLFQMGYPFAYSLNDIADYMIAKDRLMGHWFATMSDRIVRVRYEDLVTNFETQARRLLEAAKLTWDARVLEFHREQSASATASAAQVRQPVHTRSVGAWMRHSQALDAIAQRFEKAGML